MAMQKVFKRAASQVAGASNKGAKVAAPKAAGYGSITSQGKKDASEYLGMASNGSMAGASFRDRSNLMGGCSSFNVLVSMLMTPSNAPVGSPLELTSSGKA